MSALVRYEAGNAISRRAPAEPVVCTVYHGSVPHDVTPSDLLWLARALDGEGGDERAVTATLVQRWVMLGGVERMPLGTFVQAYAQAISPLWLADGARCRPGGLGHGTAACSPERTAARARRRARRWDELRDEARDAVVWAFFTDDLPQYLPTSVHYATSDLVARKLRSREARDDGWEVLEDTPNDGHAYVSTSVSRADTTPLMVLPGDVDDLDQLGRLQTTQPRRALPAGSSEPTNTSSDAGPLIFGALMLGGGLLLANRRRT